MATAHRKHEITSVTSFASPFSDFMAPTPQELKRSTRSNLEPINHISFSSPYADFTAARPYEILSDDINLLSEAATSQRSPYKTSISYASPFSDFSGPRYDQEIAHIHYDDNHYQTDMSFATPYADVMAGPLSMDSKPVLAIQTTQEPYEPSLSFASPESDFTFLASSNIDDDHSDVVHAARQVTFATPFADILAPSLFEMAQVAEPVAATSLSFATPESDFCGSSVEGLVAKSFPTDLSFASPESDFISAPLDRQQYEATYEPIHYSASIATKTAPLTYEAAEADAAAFSSIPRNLKAALLPSPQARVITEVQPPFRITHVNAAWEGLCGFSQSEALGKTLEMLQGPETLSRDLELINARVLKREDVSMVLVNYKKNGSSFVNHLRVVPLTAGPGSTEVTHMMGVLEDVTHSYATGKQ